MTRHTDSRELAVRYCDDPACGCDMESRIRTATPAPLTPDEVTAEFATLNADDRDVRALNATIKALRAERDEAVTLLHRMIDAMTSEELNCDDPVDDACTFLSRLASVRS